MIKSGNPALSKKTFDNLKSKTGEVMTLDGAVNKIAISLAVLLFAAYYTYTNAVMNYVWVGSIGGFIVALVTIYKKELPLNKCNTVLRIYKYTSSIFAWLALKIT
jgi:uncharacterized YccA/Bax inhibitor family protein